MTAKLREVSGCAIRRVSDQIVAMAVIGRYRIQDKVDLSAVSSMPLDQNDNKPWNRRSPVWFDFGCLI